MAQSQIKLFCDLDGTLLDVTSRHYKVYSELITEYAGKAVAKETYWKLKRDSIKWQDILSMSGVDSSSLNSFMDKFINKIEDPSYLSLDSLFPGVEHSLRVLSSKYPCVLVSLRRKAANLHLQMEDLGLSKYFKTILTGHSETDGFDVKISLIKRELDGYEGVIIGDTEADIITGKELGLQTIGVLSGLRNRDFLTNLNPDYIVNSFNDVVAILK